MLYFLGLFGVLGLFRDYLGIFSTFRDSSCHILRDFSGFRYCFGNISGFSGVLRILCVKLFAIFRGFGIMRDVRDYRAIFGTFRNFSEISRIFRVSSCFTFGIFLRTFGNGTCLFCPDILGFFVLHFSGHLKIFRTFRS